ncbi:putative amidoligase enzyme domain containing protein [Naviculisporaceae sp. PSN 640]
MATQNSYQFGVEIELLLGSRKKSHPNWKSLARDLSKRLAKAGIANHVNEGNDKSRENYREWSLAQEITIPSQPAKNLWGIELVSPIYPIYSYWAADLDKIFSVLHSSSFQIVPSPNCSTHVHISSTPLPLSAQELAALARSVLYYEPALDLLVPTNRRGSVAYWCQSNRANPTLRQVDAGGLGSCLGLLDEIVAAGPSISSIQEAYQYGDDDTSPGGSSSSFSSSSSTAATSISEEEFQTQAVQARMTRNIVAAMNLFPANSAYGRSHGKKKDFMRGKVYKWDFTGMLPSSYGTGDNGGAGRGTVEFRQPPGSLSAEDAAGWITLAVAFVAGAMAVGPHLGHGTGGADEIQGGSPEELWGLLAAGSEALGWESLGAVEGLFARMG